MKQLGAVLLLAIVGCAQGTSESFGSEGGAGGSGGAGQLMLPGDGGAMTDSGGSSTSVTNGSTSSSLSVTVATTTGGQMTCDSGDCASCHQCAMASVCSASYGACTASLDCTNLNNCLNGCPVGDQPCLGGCEATYPSGVPLLQAASTCVYCQGCFNTCNGAAAGC